MEELGNFLIRLGPVFAVIFFTLLIGIGVTLVTISSVRLLRHDGDRTHARA
jgi:hypothetical protein